MPRSTSLPRRIGAAAVAASALLAVCAACTAPKDDATVRMVALGDSVASGPDIATSTTACERSDHNYPSLVAEAIGADLTDMTCGGATTDTVLAGRDDPGAMKRQAQVDALDEDTDLVTITIGANDSEAAAQYFLGCFVPPANTAAACTQAVDAITRVIPQTRESVIATLDKVQERAPAAQVVLVGYLPLTPPTGCANAPIAPSAVAALAGYEGALERALEDAAHEAGVTFVSVRAAAQGHDACSKNRWVNGLKPAAGDGAFLHPTAAGAQAMATAVQKSLDVGR